MGKTNEILISFGYASVIMFMIAISFATLVGSANATQPQINVSNCSNVNQSGYYVLINNLTPNTSSFNVSPVCFNITASNVTFDCHGNKIYYDNVSGATNDNIFLIQNVNNVTLKNCSVVGFNHSVEIYNSSSVNVSDNHFNNTYLGVYLYNSNNCTVMNNSFYNNPFDNNNYAIFMNKCNNNSLIDNVISYLNYGISLNNSNNNIIAKNIIVGNESQLWFYWSCGLIINDSYNNFVDSNNVSFFTCSMSLNNNHGSTFNKSTFNNNDYGIIFKGSSYNNSISGCDVKNNSNDGIVFYNSTNDVSIVGCSILNNVNGIRFYNSARNITVSDCEVGSNVDGIYFNSTYNTTINDCYFVNNFYNGITFNGLSDNVIINFSSVINNSYGIVLSNSSHNIVMNSLNISNNGYGVDFGSLVYVVSNATKGNDVFYYPSYSNLSLVNTTLRNQMNYFFSAFFYDLMSYENNTIMNAFAFVNESNSSNDSFVSVINQSYSAPLINFFNAFHFYINRSAIPFKNYVFGFSTSIINQTKCPVLYDENNNIVLNPYENASPENNYTSSAVCKYGILLDKSDQYNIDFYLENASGDYYFQQGVAYANETVLNISNKSFFNGSDFNLDLGLNVTNGSAANLMKNISVSVFASLPYSVNESLATVNNTLKSYEKYYHFDIGNYSNISYIYLNVRYNNTWVSNNHIDPATLSLYRWTNNTWVR
ncbi:MAG: hypothetical protein GWP09_01655, partial [Nitrospiraceae bacterium]|nr:hypothetical protein [Nitrospiraceae bacterium]